MCVKSQLSVQKVSDKCLCLYLRASTTCDVCGVYMRVLADRVRPYVCCNAEYHKKALP